MNEKQGKKSGIHVICGIAALVCAAAMFAPIGRERGHFDQYGQILHRGELPYFIAHVVDAPGGSEVAPFVIGALLVIPAAILLVIWAVNSFRGTAKTGLAAAIVNLAATAFTTLLCLAGGFDGAPLLGVVIGLAVLAIAALVLAIVQRRAAR